MSKENKLLYPISINYGKKDWNLTSALRELLSNMLDTKGEYEYYYKNGLSYIRDYGKGLSKKDFVFGESTRDNSQIGQFGEGLKMALITFLRYDRKVVIKTTNFSVSVEKVNFDNAEVMQLTFGNDCIEQGTLVICECNEMELNEAAKLFLSLTPDLKKVDENVFLPGGDVYVLGLKTTSMSNLLFSYNFIDKSMTNRDRNIVDSNKLYNNLEKAISKIKNVKAMKVFFENMETNPMALEYQHCKSISNIDLWKKTLGKVHGSKICLSSDLQSDLNAYVMGYKIIRNLAPQLNYLLSNVIRVAKSNIIAQNYKDTGLVQKEKIIYPISSAYCSGWSISDAIREFIANAIDTGTEMRVEYKNGNTRIVDMGDGIHKKHFIFGVSEGKGFSDIGQFGEGLKVASLVLARNNRKVEIQTVGYTYSAAIEKNEEFDSDLFVVYFKKNNRQKGTVITFECTEKELETTKNLFSVFKAKKEKVISTEKLDFYPEEPGAVYVNGLRTATLDCCFGYNIKDKSFVNSRDRNGVDSSKIMTILTEVLPTIADESLVESFLTKWKTMPYAIEYLRGFKITSDSLWVKIAKKLFKKACVESTWDLEANFIAKQAEYEVLKNVPIATIGTILNTAKIPNAEQIAKKYKNSGILIGERLVYPISPKYCLNWTIEDAIRELIANALDTKSKISITHDNGYVTISDKGEGVAKANLLFGSSSKTEDEIGHFGEGLKMASLVLARNDRDFKLVTNGYMYKAKIERDKEFNSDVLVLHLKKSKKRKGTDITFKCSENELKMTKEKFIKFNESLEKIGENIYNPGGSVYVNGVFIAKQNTLFSYDISDKNRNLLSRDRKTINTEVKNILIRDLVCHTDSELFINAFMRPHLSKEEAYYDDLRLSSTVKDKWKSVLKKKYPKYCLPSYTEHDLAAKDKGYNLLVGFTNSQLSIFTQVGFENSSSIIILKGDESYVDKRFDTKTLTETQKNKYKTAIKKFKKLYGKEAASKIEVVESFNGNNVGPDTIGLYVPKTDKIYVLSVLITSSSYSLSELIGTLIHEHRHRVSGASDRTREFENDLTNELGRIVAEYV